jgi:hypothetical protein
MAVIRVPEEAKALLPLCRKHEEGPSDNSVSACFDTYADLLLFAAAYGFAEMSGRPPRRKSKFLERPNPIDLGIFKTDRRLPQILMIALATSGDQNVVRDEDLICHLIEDFAALGCERLSKKLDQRGGQIAHLALAKILTDADHFDVSVRRPRIGNIGRARGGEGRLWHARKESTGEGSCRGAAAA